MFLNEYEGPQHLRISVLKYHKSTSNVFGQSQNIMFCLFYFILFYFILFYFILFYFIFQFTVSFA